MNYTIPKNAGEVLIKRLLDGWSKQDIINAIMGYNPHIAKFPQPTVNDLFDYLLYNYERHDETATKENRDLFSDWELSDYVNNFRNMWLAMSILTERDEEAFSKRGVLLFTGIFPRSVFRSSFLCEYVKNLKPKCPEFDCKDCPISWNTVHGEEIFGCFSYGTPYFKWKESTTFRVRFKDSAKYAKEISELPLREEYKNEERSK